MKLLQIRDFVLHFKNEKIWWKITHNWNFYKGEIAEEWDSNLKDQRCNVSAKQGSKI